MAELVDALVSGTSEEHRGGSSPLLGTNLIEPDKLPTTPNAPSAVDFLSTAFLLVPRW